MTYGDHLVRGLFLIGGVWLAVALVRDAWRPRRRHKGCGGDRCVGCRDKGWRPSPLARIVRRDVVREYRSK